MKKKEANYNTHISILISANFNNNREKENFVFVHDSNRIFINSLITLSLSIPI